LVQLHRPGLVRFVDLLIWDADEAESLAQEALTRAYSQLADFRNEMRFAAWLRGIALNLARNHLRQRARRAKVTDPAYLSSLAAAGCRGRGVLSGIVKREAGAHLDQAIRLLPAPLREAFVLHATEGLTFAEVGRLMGITEGTARVRAHRARTLLRGRLGPVVDTWYREANAR
jgi:RNA polymerase sigma-70 factor (ECF subfamily)